MMISKHSIASLAILFAALWSGRGQAQAIYSEDFTGIKSNNDWYFFNGACLTAGTSTSTASPGTIPGCVTVLSTYYSTRSDRDPSMVGGNSGCLGSSPSGTPATCPSVQVADPVGGGALRFTNGSPYGHNENGAIVSKDTFGSGQGLQISFKTITYRGNTSSGGDGADGISFFLMDGNQPAGLGAFGGSLAYSCANNNSPYDGLKGGYIGLGIDEWGNFLNGSALVSGYTGPNVASGDNTAYGYGYKPGRIGLRGAGSISWSALTAAYGTDPGDSTKPYYPASLATTCSNGGVYSASTNSCGQACTTGYYNSGANTCDVCTVGTFNSGTNTCNSCSSGVYSAGTNSCSPAATCSVGTYNAGTNTCTPQCSAGSFNSATSKCDVCPVGYTFDKTHAPSPNTKPCAKCASGGTYNPATGSCSSGALSWVAWSSATNPAPLPTPTLTTAVPTTVSPVAGVPYYLGAVKHTCSTGTLWNYSTASTPTNAGAATLANSANTAKILDYAPIPNAYKELTGVQIANESAVTRSDGTPIFYNLKITQDGLLSLSYSYGGAAYQSVIKNRLITAANGPLPASFRFGFGGSTGGATNIHEIMCFKAASTDQSGSSATVNEKQAAKVEAGTQAYFAFYNPNNWTGTVTANTLINTAGVVTVSTLANWDAACLLTGTSTGLPSAGGGCATTNVTGPTSPNPTFDKRVMLTWDTTNKIGIPFEWTNLSSSQQQALDAGDTDPTSPNRLNYLRGDTSNNVTTLGTGLYRAREGILGDIVDSSPNWVGPPTSPYTATWKDRLYSSATMLENSGTQNYVQFVAAEQTRLNVVYGGANDGFLHGFRAGSFDGGANFVDNSTTPNDGQEVLAYMPGSILQSAASPSTANGCTISNGTGSVVQNIHGLSPAVAANPPTIPAALAQCVDPALDYSNTQYGHNFFVDATPGTGDLFYGGVWHTWLVGGLGMGGNAIYALDITDPLAANTLFQETNASRIVIGEWNSATITCAGNTTCGNSLGNTFGVPQIRRLHNGDWGVIFGNGFNSTNGDAGIFVMTVDNSAAATKTFYYISAPGGAGGNGIAFATPADLDGDHITDYVYAGDLKGNVWRFDLTSSDPTQWSAASAPMFTTSSGQPITSQLLVISTAVTGSQPRLLIEFGTGQRTQLSNTAPVSFAGGGQALYGIWDWNLSAWNTLAPGSKYASLAASTTATGLASPFTMQPANLQQQALTINAQGVRDQATTVAVCWQGSTTCTSGNTQFGWFATLPGGSEQIIFNPVFFQGAFIVDSTVPATNIPTSCTTNSDSGFTYVLSVANGGVFTNAFPTYRDKNGVLITDSIEAGVQTNATGSVYVVTTPQGTSNIIFQTVSGTPGSQQVNIPSNTKAKRLTWIERR